MADSELVSLATRLQDIRERLAGVDKLKAEEAEIAAKLKAIISATARPTRARRHSNGAGRQAEAEDTRVLEAIRAAPGGLKSSAISKLLAMPQSSCGNRLSRLEARLLIERRPDGHWSATSPG
jgi:hypothetical protein